ncbi:FAD binding monooxygenase [Aspergillus bombycis]|uniref:FAD binding monooxygenase n=1 Tax=Aspergillus bombycis TaxID=109264 RepID=A0A1F7ZT90_9EURO|nr:FAD binding monooxygenase [Aspergillus bombycis]OGM42673.1 FAD binding monooxygenase [Aspergillus bombycis]
MCNKDHFRVIIVGGSVAGLTLAHCLQQAGIDHVVLEKSPNLSPQVGASIGIIPNGGRILDQLGLFDAVEKMTHPLSMATITYPDGFSFCSNYPKIVDERFGYPIAFLDRQKFLEILHTTYPEPSNIHTDCRVTHIRRLDSHIEVVTSSGLEYMGHLVVGADGVHSIIRSEMWKLADALEPGRVSKREKRSMKVEYACVFGISSPVSGLNAGDQVNAFHDGLTIITIQGKHGRVFWFVIQKLDDTYTYPDTVRFSSADAVRTCEKVAHFSLTNGATFGQVWENREVTSMTALEENIFSTWHADRIVCIGDSIHKQMTPNIGQGANTAIEDAAVLTNLLYDRLSENGYKKLSRSTLEQLLREFQFERFSRVNKIYQDSRFLVRLHARDGIVKSLLARYIVPRMTELPAELASKSIADGPTISFLPMPSRSGPGWVQWSRKERRFSALWILVLLVIVVSFSLHSPELLPGLWSNSLVSRPTE